MGGQLVARPHVDNEGRADRRWGQVGSPLSSAALPPANGGRFPAFEPTPASREADPLSFSQLRTGYGYLTSPPAGLLSRPASFAKTVKLCGGLAGARSSFH